MATNTNYWNRLFQKIQAILTALQGGEPVIDDNYDGVYSTLWRRLFEKLDTIIAALVGHTADYDGLINKPAIDGTTLTKDSTAAALGLQKVNPPYKGASNVAGILITLGDIAQGNEVIFNLLYNETSAGNLVIHAVISGQFYAGSSGALTVRGWFNTAINLFRYMHSIVPMWGIACGYRSRPLRIIRQPGWKLVTGKSAGGSSRRLTPSYRHRRRPPRRRSRR
jgi:hypothetical protein